MSVLCERPDSEFFLTIPDLHVAVHSFADNEVESKLELFGHIFVKYGVTNEYGLVMVHRHFDISREEILVETINDEKTISVLRRGSLLVNIQIVYISFIISVTLYNEFQQTC